MNKEKEKKAINILKTFEPTDEPYYLCYSGGKDSDCIRILAGLAGVKHDIVHNLTTVDAPETVRYVKSIPNVKIRIPEKSMWQIIADNSMPPTRLYRYCCKYLKENGGQGRLKVTGVRASESKNRQENGGTVKILGKPKTVKNIVDNEGAEAEETKKGGIVLNYDNDESRRVVEQCYRATSTMVNPILDWEERDVWSFLNYYGCKSNPLYQQGYKRIGCIGCPMQGFKGMKAQFYRYPKYKNLYIRAFDRMLKNCAERDIHTKWHNGNEVYAWWVGDDINQERFEV